MEKILKFFRRHPFYFVLIVGVLYLAGITSLFIGALLIIKAVFF